MNKKTICIVGIVLAVFVAGIMYSQAQTGQADVQQPSEATVTTATSVVDDVDDTEPLEGIYAQYQAILYSHTTIDITTTAPTIADFFSNATLTAALDDPAVQEDLTNLLDLFGITPIDGNGAYTRSNALQATYIYYNLAQLSSALTPTASLLNQAELKLTSATDIEASIPMDVSDYTNTLSYNETIDFTASMTRAQAYAIIAQVIVPQDPITTEATDDIYTNTTDTLKFSDYDVNLSQVLTLANENALLDLTDIDDLNGEITMLEVVTLIAQLDQYKQTQANISAENSQTVTSASDLATLAIQSSTTDDVVKISLTDLTATATATATAPTQNPEALEAAFESLSQYLSQSALDNLINTDTYTNSVNTLTLCNLLSAYLLPSNTTESPVSSSGTSGSSDGGLSGSNSDINSTTTDTPDTTVIEEAEEEEEAPTVTTPTVTTPAVVEQPEPEPTVTTPAVVESATPSTTTTESSTTATVGRGTVSTITSEQLQAQEDNAQPSGNNVTFN